MSSSLTWIDYDGAARERTQRILALFHEREARDELGLGAVYGSLSDQLFPGTSTIQTRLRYMFFVPWVYQALSNAGVPAERIERAEKQEHQNLIGALLASGEKQGVLGQVARQGLVRYPASVYWTGLRTWGLRSFDGSQEDLHANPSADGLWDPDLPSAPDSFPDGATFKLTVEEATYLRGKLRGHAHSLLAHLAEHRVAGIESFDAPWDLPAGAVLPHHRVLLREAERVSFAMLGAAFLYNLMLARKVGNEELTERYELALRTWHEQRAPLELGAWELPKFWAAVHGHGHRITLATVQFVERWVELARADSLAQVTSPAAEALVRRRESMLKGPQSRFSNDKALRRWGGASGTARVTYRFRTAKQFLSDLYGAG